jgi:hypothetical protein
MSYTVNQTVRFTLETRVDEALVEPTESTFTLRAPDGTTIALTKSGAGLVQLVPGRYRGKVKLTVPGLWWWSLETTGPAAGYAEGNLAVEASRIPA